MQLTPMHTEQETATIVVAVERYVKKYMGGGSYSPELDYPAAYEARFRDRGHRTMRDYSNQPAGHFLVARHLIMIDDPDVDIREGDRLVKTDTDVVQLGPGEAPNKLARYEVLNVRRYEHSSQIDVREDK